MAPRPSFRAGLTGFALLLLACFAPLPAQAGDEELRATLAPLRAADFSTKAVLVETLVAANHPRTVAILTAFTTNRLHYAAAFDRMVISADSAAEMTVEDAVTGEALGPVGRRDLDRITTNNRLRALIGDRLARMGLASADPRQRLAAVEAFVRNPDPAGAVLLQERQTLETDPQIAAQLKAALALIDLTSADPAVRAQAAEVLGGRIQAEIRGRLMRVAADDPDATVRLAAQEALAKTELRLRLLGWAETLFFGLSLGSVLVLAAIGLTVTFG
jgi:urea transport system permease protein